MLREDLDRIDSVPMLPELVGKILTMIDDPNVSSHQLAAVVSKDLSLVASILRIINSAYYGFRWRIASVNQAVVLLGFRTIRNLVLAATVMNAYGGQSPSGAFDRTVHWRHSIACGAASSVLAKTWKVSQAEEAFLTGLIHDIGRVIMDQYFPAEFAEAVRMVNSEGMALTATEDRVFGLTHADIGRHVAQKWKFPGAIVSAIGDHHGPRPDTEWGELAALVHVADAMTRTVGLAVGDWEAAIDEGALAAVGHDAAEIEELQEAFLEEYKRSNIFEGLLT